MPTWPASLPEAPLLGQAKITMKEVRATFPPDVGPPTIRPRPTTAGEGHTVTFAFTAAQLSTFRTFHGTTLSNGASSFTMPYPVDGSDQTFQFLSPPVILAVTDDIFRVTLKLYMEPFVTP